MADPRVISAISVIFALVGAYNLYIGSRRMRDARLAGQPTRWYKQISFLAGLEYILLTFVFLLSLTNRQGTVTASQRIVIVPLYFILLILAAIVAAMVIRQGLLNVRASRANRTIVVPAVQSGMLSEQILSKADEEKQRERQRDRRKKAAASRRRRAGKA